MVWIHTQKEMVVEGSEMHESSLLFEHDAHFYPNYVDQPKHLSWLKTFVEDPCNQEMLEKLVKTIPNGFLVELIKHGACLPPEFDWLVLDTPTKVNLTN